ncbi:unnamed protein product [Oikopleura dioica]|uniref:Uncharacterized protein n=1 Tax=Oikopleura dioica TaxID=34765 RepID=E4XFQ7_OIKDI|nr:unnamed protein product [Oikopleura dioica]
MGSSTEASAPIIMENVQTGAPPPGAPPPYDPSMTTAYNANHPQQQLPYPPAVNTTPYYPANQAYYQMPQQQQPVAAVQSGYTLVPQQPQIQNNQSCPQFNEDPPRHCF